MNDPRRVTEALKRCGLAVRVDGGRATVTLSFLRNSDPLRAREIVYRALQGLEPHFSVFLDGAPPCFLPDAWDHFDPLGLRSAKASRIAACRKCALKALCPGVDRNSVFYGLRSALKPVLAAPAEIVFELTGECDLACRVCFSRKTADRADDKLVRRLLVEAKELGVRDIRFTGGEPFLSPNLVPLLRAARKSGFYTIVNTNACGADRGLLEKAAPFMDNVLVSLQAYDQEGETRATRVPGKFGLKLANMRFLRKRVPVFRLGTVASPELVRDFDHFYRLASELKADVWEIYRPMVGGGAEDPRTALGPGAMARLSAAAAAKGAGGPRVLLANPLPLCLVPEAERKGSLGAAFDDGHTRLVLDPRGFFKPGYHTDLRLGTGILKAWRSSHLRRLRSFDWLPAGCRKCGWLLKCLGGSRFLARAAGGGYFGPDPWLPARGRGAR